MRIQVGKIATVLALGSLNVLAGCGGGNNNTRQIIGTNAPQYCTMHANPFIGNVDFGMNDITKTSNIASKSISNYFGIDVAASTATVSNAGSSTPLVSTGFTPASGHRYAALVLVDANGSTTSLTLIGDLYNKSILSDRTRVRVFNASYNAPNVNVYVTAPNMDLSAIVPTTSGIGYDGVSLTSMQDSVCVDGGTYRAWVATAETKNITFISQPFNLASNADWLITTLPVGGVGAVTPNAIRVLVTQANSALRAASRLPSQ